MSDEIIKEKKLLRKCLIEERERIPAEEARKTDAAIASYIFGSDFYRDAESVFVFISVVREVGTGPVIDRAYADGKTVLVPRTKKHGFMEAVPVEKAELERAFEEWPRSFGIPEPPDDMPAGEAPGPDLVIVPSLVLDLWGFRIGYGKGYYDRFIAAARVQKKCPFFAAVQRAAYVRDKALPREPYDMSVDLIVTENGLIIPFSSV